MRLQRYRVLVGVFSVVFVFSAYTRAEDGGVAGAEFGACCVNNICTNNVWSVTCANQGGQFAGDGVACAPGGKCVPTMSQWGLLCMALAVASAGCVLLRQRRITAMA